MTDLDRVLESLLHDLRSPLGVAGGYLRLLREQRLPTGADTERAIVKTQDALRTMTTLCGEASDWLKLEPSTTPQAVPVEALVAHIVAEADRMRLAVEVVGATGGTTTLALDGERVARAVVSLLAVVAGDTSARCTLRLAPDRLSVAVTGTEQRGAVAPGPFDPWAYPGLAAALACRTIAQAGGRCLRGPAASDIARVEFDLTGAGRGDSPEVAGG